MKKDKKLMIRLSEEQIELLQKKSNALGHTKSGYARHIIIKELNNK